MTTTTLEAIDQVQGYRAELDAPHSINSRWFNTYTLGYSVTLRSTQGVSETFQIGESRLTSGTALRTALSSFMPGPPIILHTGVHSVTSLRFDDGGLEVKYLSGRWQPGHRETLKEKTKYIPRREFPK